MGVWDELMGKVNDAEMIQLKAELLAHLILDSSSMVHRLVEGSRGMTFSSAQKQQSDAETAALYLALCRSFISRWMDKDHVIYLASICKKTMIDSLAARAPDDRLTTYFDSRVTTLYDVLNTSVPELRGAFLPGFRESYEAQCEILKIPKDAAIAVSTQSLMMASIRRWQLQELVTGHTAS